jgi:hypothetical protein
MKDLYTFHKQLFSARNWKFSVNHRNLGEVYKKPKKIGCSENCFVPKFRTNIISIEIKKPSYWPAEYKKTCWKQSTAFCKQQIAPLSGSSYGLHILKVNKMYFLYLRGYSGITCIKKILGLNIRYWLPSHGILFLPRPLYRITNSSATSHVSSLSQRNKYTRPAA